MGDPRLFMERYGCGKAFLKDMKKMSVSPEEAKEAVKKYQEAYGRLTCNSRKLDARQVVGVPDEQGSEGHNV